MKPKTVIISFLPTLLYLTSFLYLSISPLNVSRIIDLQTDVSAIFFESLSSGDIVTSLGKIAGYVWTNVGVHVAIFLALISLGLVTHLIFIEEIDFRILIISLTLLVILTYPFTKSSIVLLLSSMGLSLSILFSHKFFEPKKHDFSTGFDFVKSKVGLMNLFLALGIFLAVFSNIQSYEEQIRETNIDTIQFFLPDTSELGEIQREKIIQESELFKSSLSQQYQTLPSQVQRDCGFMYDGIIQGIDNYEKEYLHQLETQTDELDVNQILEAFPVFDVFVKATPLLLAVMTYTFLAFFTPLIAFLGGVIYLLAKKIRSQYDHLGDVEHSEKGEEYESSSS